MAPGAENYYAARVGRVNGHQGRNTILPPGAKDNFLGFSKPLAPPRLKLDLPTPKPKCRSSYTSSVVYIGILMPSSFLTSSPQDDANTAFTLVT